MHDGPADDHQSALHLDTHTVHPPHDLGAIERFDAAVDELLDHLRGTEPADRIFYAITELGDFGLIWLLIGAVRALRTSDERRECVRLFACMGVESLLVNGAIKQAFKRERPVIEQERPYNIRIPLTTSFPSGHASSAVLAATLLSERSRFAPLYWGLAVCVAGSRAYVRIHHASDVVGGVAVGFALGAIAKRAWPLPPKGSSRWRGNGRSR